LFSHFIPCGVWAAVYLLDGLLKNLSDIQPDTIHGDTQAQSTPVFGLAALLGITLMPRILHWKDLTMYRPDTQTSFTHIDPLVSNTMDWHLIGNGRKAPSRPICQVGCGPCSRLKRDGFPPQHSCAS
jgi:TnpA family transposase